MPNVTPVPAQPHPTTPVLAFVMAAVVGTLVAAITGDLRFALVIVALIVAGAGVGMTIARRRRR
jgi:hypothetical protein